MKKCSVYLVLAALLLVFPRVVQPQDDAQTKWDDEAEAVVDKLHLDTMFTVQSSVVDGNGCRMILTADGVIYVIKCIGLGRDAGDELQGKVTYESGRMVIKYLGGGFRGIKPGSPVVHGEHHGPWKYNVVTAPVLRMIR
jgi:hypothetical protein